MVAAPPQLAAQPSSKAAFLEALDEASAACPKSRRASTMNVAGVPLHSVEDDVVDDRSTFHSPALQPIQNYEEVDLRNSTIHHVWKEARDIERLKRDLGSKVAVAKDAKVVLEQEEERLRELRRQLSAGGHVDPARLGFQEREVGKAWAVLTQAEKERDAADLAIGRIADKERENQHRQQRQGSLLADAAREKYEEEIRRAQRTVKREAESREATAETYRLEEEERRRRDDAAEKNRTIGRKKLKDTQQVQEDRRFEADLIRDSHFDHNAQRMLTLKASLDKVNRKMKASNEARRKEQTRKEAEHARRKDDLLSQGLNPYEVYRREDMQLDKEQQKDEMTQRNQLRSEKLIEQLIEEDKRYKNRIKAEAVKRDEMLEFQQQMGNYAREKRVVAYIKKMTIGNVEVLDPAGSALRIDPSKVTIQKTHAFGTGRASMDEIKMVRRDVQRTKASLGEQRKSSKETMRKMGIADSDSEGDQEIKALAMSAPVISSRGMDGEDEDALPEGKLWVPKLTDLEKQYLAAARERQKQNMTIVQKCWGREFKGDAFLAKPSVIAFDDFEVGKKYRQVVEVTNVSFTFNQFKLLPLDDRIKEFFDIDFVPPGRMSAGVTRLITVWFVPKTYKDIVTVFPILAQTGRIDFPMKCTTKKTILTITPQDSDASPIVDFGVILDGEQGVRVLSIKNTGALAAGFILEPLEDTQDFLPMVKFDSTDQQVLIARGTTKVKFTFAPTRLGDFSAALRLKVDNSAVGDAHFFQEVQVRIKGSCTDVPIWVEREEYQMKMCLFEHTFRENIMLHNRQSTAMKVVVELPKSIEGQLQLTPEYAFVQGHGEQAIQVKFSPKKDFLQQNPQYRDKRHEVDGVSGGHFRIPVKIIGVDQVLPVLTALVGTLTTSKILFEPSVLKFGRCFVGSSVVCRVTLINLSELPQEFAMMRLPNFLSIMDVPQDVVEEELHDNHDAGPAILEGGGSAQFGMLLPKERRELCVTYAPDAALEMNYKMLVKAITGSLSVHDLYLECKGQGIDPILKLSHTQVTMASIPCNAACSENVMVTNVSKTPYMINVLMPAVELSGLYASPVCCVMKPGEHRQIRLEFKPTQTYLNVLNLPKGQEPEAPEAAKTDEVVRRAHEERIVEATAEHRKQTLKLIRTTGGRRWEAPVLADKSPPPDRPGSPGSLGPEEGDVAATASVEESLAPRDVGPRTVHASWRLAIALRPLQQDGTPAAIEAMTTEQKRNFALYFGVRTCVLRDRLSITPHDALDFGEVTAGQRRVLPLTLENLVPEEDQALEIEALPEKACFTVLNAPRTISSQPLKMLVQFLPERAPQIYQTVLRFRTKNTRVQVELRGLSVRAVLKIEPADGILQLGSVIYSKDCKDFTQAKFEVVNASRYELRYNLETVLAVEPCHAGPSPFTLAPSSGLVEPNGRREVTVTFRPHRPLELFREKIYVNVPMQKEKTFVHLFGHCFHYQAYCLPGMEFAPFDTASRSGPFLDALAVGVGSGSAPDKDFAFKSAQRKRITVKFERDERSKFVLVGAGNPVGTAGITCDFQIQQSAVSNYFTVEAPEGGKADKIISKVPLVAGKPAVKAVFRYNPPANSPLKIGDVNLDVLAGVGQWITCTAKCILTGGFVPPPTDPKNSTQEILIELKAYLEQI